MDSKRRLGVRKGYDADKNKEYKRQEERKKNKQKNKMLEGVCSDNFFFRFERRLVARPQNSLIRRFDSLSLPLAHSPTLSFSHSPLIFFYPSSLSRRFFIIFFLDKKVDETFWVSLVSETKYTIRLYLEL
jgi:hypothetical protein